MDYCIVYLSTSTDLLSQEDLTRLLQKSQQNNQTLDISGLLVFCNGSIIQVLEGNQEKVKALYALIAQDPRHKHLIKLYSQPIAHRSFPAWSMAFKTVSAKTFRHLSELMPTDSNSALPRENKMVLELIRLFYENNYRS